METVWQARLTVLHDELKHIATDTGVGWKGILDRVNKCIIFDCYLGKDRTIHQEEEGNTHSMLEDKVHSALESSTHEALEGNKKLSYIIFSEQKRNLTEGKNTIDTTNYKNVGYCAGKGENEDRLISVINADISGFERREIYIDLNNIDDPDELVQEGKKKLDTYKEISSIEGKVYQIPNMEYEKDFFLGDIVTLESNGVYEDKRIIQAKEIYERNNITVELGFGDKVPSLAEQIKQLTQRPIN